MRIRPTHRAPLLLTGLFVASRLAFYLIGVRVDDSALTGRATYIQMLDLTALHHHLAQSIWYLQSQPPYFNLASGLLLKLPPGLVQPTTTLVSLTLGLCLVLSSYFLSLELRVPQKLAFAMAAVVVLDPANLLYGSWYFYSFPTAVVMTFGVLSLARYVRTHSWLWGLSFFAALSSVVLLNSTFQWFWLAAVAAPLVIASRQHWRSVLVVAAVPVLLVSVWYVKNAVVFHTDTTSSWLGMNLAKITTQFAPRDQLARLIADKKLTPLVGIDTFSPLSAYGRSLTSHPPTGVLVLDRRDKANGSPNFNNINYIEISSRYLHNDIAYIEARPGAYASNVGRAMVFFFVPSEQYYLLGRNAGRISSYVRAFDLVIDWQLRPTDSATNPFAGVDVSLGQLSISTLLTFGIVAVLGPVIIWRRRRDRTLWVPLTSIWISTVYVFILTSAVDIGENQRFRYDLGPVPLIGAVAVIVSLVRERNSPESESALDDA